MRIKLSDADRVRLFDALKNKIGNAEAVAKLGDVSARTVRDWRKGKFLMSIDAFEKLAGFADLSKEIFPLEVLPDFWNAPDSARRGAAARMKLYGNLGTPCGDKIAGGVSMPVWILQNEDYQRAFLRGLFDTDGCIYLDKHIIKGKTYRNMGWTITSYADTLRAEVHETLRALGFSPTLTTPNLSVFLRRKDDIERYFQEIGTHNDKHLNRYQSFMSHRGDVA